MDFHMRRGDHPFHDMFFQRAARTAISSRLLHNGGFFGSRSAVSPEASRRLYGLLQSRQPTMQTFDFKNYSSLRYLTRSKENSIPLEKRPFIAHVIVYRTPHGAILVLRAGRVQI